MRSSLLLLAPFLALLPAPLGCRSDERPGHSSARPAPDALAPLPPLSLRVPPDRLSRVEITKSGTGQSTTLAREVTGWRVVSPLPYRANEIAVESIVAVLAELEITSVSEGDEATARKHGLDRATAIEVKAWAGGQLASHFLVGHSTREQTHIQVAGDSRILTVAGRCRRMFDKTTDELRDPVITSFSRDQIEGVTYSSPVGEWELVANPSLPGTFVARGPPIRNFDGDRAGKSVAVLAHLRAQGFVDSAGQPQHTGLFNDDTPRATLRVRGAEGPRRVDVWVGTRTADGRMHLRTSESEQIYLVSAHLESSLVPRRSQLERSDDTMRQLAAVHDRHDGGDGDHAGPGGSAHAHGGPAAPPSQVPPELMMELRTLAKAQQER